MEDDKGKSAWKPDHKYALWYLGCAPLDRRTTLPMLPWLVAEVRRRAETSGAGPVQARPVELTLVPPVVRCVPADSRNASVFIFEHRAQCITRFVHSSHDHAHFAYLIRSQPDNPESETACHVFRACEPSQVPEIISSVRQLSKAALKEDAKPKQDTEEAFYNSQKFEVLYCGKVMVAHKKAPSTLIDDCMDKFRHHEVERKRLHLLNGKRSSVDSCVEFIVGDGELGGRLGPGDVAAREEDEGNEEKATGEKGLSSSPSLSSLRGALPDCILEDSGPEEQPEFRARCNSLKPRETGYMVPERRRHASAPSHVQPSDAEKNRTMLFQVGRFEVNLISPESKTVVLERNFKDISSCLQGIKQTDHFGFICRDPGESGLSQYVCYVFQCASESLVDEVMLTLKQAFSTAAVLQSAKTQVKLCEACPMHDLHKLCERIEGLYPPKAKLAIQRYLSQLTDNEQADIFERIHKMKPATDQEENELVIIHLRQLCEAKQKTHLHIGEVQQQNTSNSTVSDSSATGGRFKLDIFKSKARSSLTSSLENIFSRGASRMRGRLGSMGSIGSFDQDDICTDSPPGTPSSLFPPFCEEDPEDQQFRQRAHTLSHLPAKKRISFSEAQPPAAKAPLRRHQSLAPELLQSTPGDVTRTHSLSETEPSISLPYSFSAPNFLKSFYQGPLGSLGSLVDSSILRSNWEGRRRTITGCCGDPLNVTATARKISWRQKIFLQVASPTNKPLGSGPHPDGPDARELLPLSPRAAPSGQESSTSQLLPERTPSGTREHRSPAEYRDLWRETIHQQILLLRVEKEKQHEEVRRDDLHVQKMKLDYEEVGPCPEDVLALWEKKLSALSRSKVQWSTEEAQNAVSVGVPKSRRGEVWQLVSQLHRLRQRIPCRTQPTDTPYQDLLKQLTAQQHAILVDLGRTFPTHPYFSAQLGAGQLSLYNLLKAYSLLDPEVGYCQGISFVAGVLLLHMGEDQAFDMLKFLMYDLGLRRQYLPDMASLQVQMYQLSRLLHDYRWELYSHLERQEVSPSLYAAPWFLTLFASQFPLGFVARIFDILFVKGTEVVFKVALCLLSSHEQEIMECDSFETVVEYLKSTIPNLTQAQMEHTISQVTEMDISKQLHTYEVEYHVLQDELLETVRLPDDADRLDRLERTNSQLRKQNLDLLEKLQAARVKVQSLEANVENFLSRETKMKHAIRSLEQEKASYQRTLERLRGCLPPGALLDVELAEIRPGSSSKLKAAHKRP
ncbi:TBC1 domain family member 4-like isoform X1 [Scleropages formosus]|uniref:TBC1 domain family member 4 n=1 Tax=Scleropages formosus TaxID=113540 RepID=A0A8C9W2N3_SCLFO|nr:TBC1 domain family member 4-like isoform X1 [Scleropages formosus]